MRFNWRRRTNEASGEETTKSSMELFWQEWEERSNQPLSEITEPLIALHHLKKKFREAWINRDAAEVHRLLAEGTRHLPHEPMVRQLAADVFRRLGDQTEALSQLSILIATHPNFATAYPRLARILLDRGEREAAVQVLNAGWSHIPHWRRARERAKYFLVLDEESSAAVGTDQA